MYVGRTETTRVRARKGLACCDLVFLYSKVYYTVLYYTILYYTILQYTILSYIIL